MMKPSPNESLDELRHQLETLREDCLDQKRKVERTRQAAVHIAVGLKHLARALGEGEQQS